MYIYIYIRHDYICIFHISNMQLTIIHTYMYVFILLCRLCVIVKFFIISNHMYIYIYIIHMYIWICIYIYIHEFHIIRFFPSAPSMNKSYLYDVLHFTATWHGDAVPKWTRQESHKSRYTGWVSRLQTAGPGWWMVSWENATEIDDD